MKKSNTTEMIAVKDATAPHSLLDSLFQETVERYTLDNGLVVLLKPDDSSALVSVQAWVKTGSIHEGEFLGSGLSHFLEHMLFKGTRKREGAEIASHVQEHGGNMNAYTTFDRTVYYIDIPSEHVETALDVLADAVFDSTLPKEEVEKERDVILREIDMGLDDPDHQLSEALFAATFREHPYRYPIIGYREVFETASHQNLLRYYQTRYVPNNCVLVVTGDIESSGVMEMVKRHFGHFKRSRIAPVFIPPEPEQLARREVHLQGEVNITREGLAFKIPGLSHPDAPALVLLSSIMGNGKSSLLWKRVRDEGKCVHEIDAATWNPGASGLFWISFTADAELRERATETILMEVDRICREGVPEKLMKKALRQALVSEVNVRKTISGQASRLGIAEVVVGDLDFAKNYFSRLAALTPEDLLRTARAYFQQDRLTVVSLDPRSVNGGSSPKMIPRKKAVRFEELKLDNGSRLLLQRNSRLPNLHIRLLCRGGGSYEPAPLRGVTSLLATLLTQDTKKRSAAEVAEAIEEAGGRFSEFCGNNTVGLSVEVLPEDSALAIDILEQAILYPLFQKNTFAHEKEAHLAGLKEESDDILTYGIKALRQRFFADHPLAIGASGTEETASRIEVEDVARHYRNLILPENIILSAAGDMEGTDIEGDLTRFLERIPGGPFHEKNPPFSGPSLSGKFKTTMSRQQAVVFQAYPDKGVADPEFHIGEVMDELFSGMSSQLFKQVREMKSLAYFVGSNRTVGVNEGMFFLYGGTQPERVEEVLAEMDAEINRVQKGKIDPDELRRCQVRLKARKRISLQTNGARAMQAALNAAYDLPINDWLAYDEKIDAVTVDDLRRFAGDHFLHDRKVTLVVGPDGEQVD